MHCLTGLTTILKDQFKRFRRSSNFTSTTSSTDKPATVHRQQIGLPRNVRKEEDPFGSLLALSGNGGDQAFLLQEKHRAHSLAAAAAARTTPSNSSPVSLPTRPAQPPKRALPGSQPPRASSAHSSGFSVRTAVAGDDGGDSSSSDDTGRGPLGAGGKTDEEGDRDVTPISLSGGPVVPA